MDPGEGRSSFRRDRPENRFRVWRGGLREIAELKEVRPGRLHPGGYDACSYRRPRPGGGGYAWSVDDLKPERDDFDEAHPFYEAEIVFTGTLQSMQRKDAMQAPCSTSAGGP